MEKESISEADIQRVVRVFYEAVRHDDLLAPVFATKIKPSDWARHENHIADFWSSIFLKSGRYNGRPMPKHMALPDITPEHFVRWLSLFRRAADQCLEAEQADVFHAMAMRIANSFQMGLAFKYGKLGSAKNPFKAFGLKPPPN